MMDNPAERYKVKRRELGISREKAAFKLSMSEDKLERIENGKQIPYPEDVLNMADKYMAPELCNYYCSNQCAIGRKYIPEIPDETLPQIVLKLLDAIYDTEDLDKLLVSITADEVISEEEIESMASVQYTLDSLSDMIDALGLNIEKKISRGEIDRKAYTEAYAELAGGTGK